MNQLNIIPLGGGPGMVTNNMYLYVMGKQAIIVDCGIGFPQDKVSDDILIPDITYLKTHPLTLLGIFLTHGHDDHHAALPYILPQLSGNFPIFASRLTAGFATEKLTEQSLRQKITVLKQSDQIKLGPFTVHPIRMTHSVPDTLHFFIQTPIGNFYHGSDFKFDLTPLDNRRPDFKKITGLSQKGVLCLLSDCLRSERPGFTPSEKTIAQAIERELSFCPGRFIFTTMSSQIHRIQQAVDLAVQHGRKIAFIGRSMESNVRIATQLGFLFLPKNAVIDKSRIKKIPDHRLCLIVAGSQGQESSSLTRYADNQHRLLKIKPQDKVIYSVDIIPGNEQAVFNVIDSLAKQNVDLAYQETADDLHVSGHASAGELQLLMELVNPQYLYPIGGSFRHMRQYQKLASAIGFRNDQTILPHAAQVVEFDNDGHFRLGEKLKLKPTRINQNQTNSKQSKPRRHKHH